MTFEPDSDPMSLRLRLRRGGLARQRPERAAEPDAVGVPDGILAPLEDADAPVPFGDCDPSSES